MTIVHFLRDFDYRVSDYMTIAYSAATTVEVEDECAAEAVAKGAAEYADFAEDDLFEGRTTDDHEEE